MFKYNLILHQIVTCIALIINIFGGIMKMVIFLFAKKVYNYRINFKMKQPQTKSAFRFFGLHLWNKEVISGIKTP